MDAELATRWTRNMQATNPEMTSVKVAVALADGLAAARDRATTLESENERLRAELAEVQRDLAGAKGYIGDLQGEMATMRH